MSSPCHIELVLSEKEEPVKKEVIHPYCIKFNVEKVVMCCCSIGNFELLSSLIVVLLIYLWFVLQPESQLTTSKSKKSHALRSGASS